METNTDPAGLLHPTELEVKALRVRELEILADELHVVAQKLNKAGQYEEAKQAYAKMHTVEDEASALSQEIGCVACIIGEKRQTHSADEIVVSKNELLKYTKLHAIGAWPTVSGRSREAMQCAAVGAVAGGLVADAAAMGVHWIYDLEKLGRIEQEVCQKRQQQQAQQEPPQGAGQLQGTGGSGHLLSSSRSSQNGGYGSSMDQGAAGSADQGSEDTAEPACGLEFVDPPRSPFYAYPSGRNSPYGEQVLVLLRSLAQRGGLDCSHYCDLFAITFGLGFDGYRDVSTKGFLRNFMRGMTPPMTGAPDAQANCMVRVPPLVAAFGGDPRLMEAVQRATRVTQNSDAAVAWGCAAACILEGIVVLGVPPSVAVQRVLEELRGQSVEGGCRLEFGPLSLQIAEALSAAQALADAPPAAAAAALGRNCHMPNALQTPVQVVLHCERRALAAVRRRRQQQQQAEARGHGRLLPEQQRGQQQEHVEQHVEQPQQETHLQLLPEPQQQRDQQPQAEAYRQVLPDQQPHQQRQPAPRQQASPQAAPRHTSSPADLKLGAAAAVPAAATSEPAGPEAGAADATAASELRTLAAAHASTAGGSATPHSPSASASTSVICAHTIPAAPMPTHTDDGAHTATNTTCCDSEGPAGALPVQPPDWWDDEAAAAVAATFATGVRLALREGGCCASRAGFVGACLGAVAGIEGIPEEWRAKYGAWGGVVRDAQALCDARAAVIAGGEASGL